VVVVDGTASGEAAIDWAIGRSRAGPVAIEVTAVFDPMPSESVMAGEAVRSAFAALLESGVERIARAAPGSHPVAVLRTGHARVELAAASRDADLVVIGSGGSDAGIGRTLPIRLASAAHCPVVVVPVAWGGARDGVVVGLESTDLQPLVIDFAAREAARAGQPLTVVQAWNVPTLAAVAMFAHPGVWGTTQGLHAQALEHALTRVRTAFPEVELHHRIREGVASRILAEEAASASLLVVGRHDRSTVGDALLGSTSHELLLAMTCAVAVVPE